MKPAAVPFTLQAYTGFVPPLTGLAVNVTEVPAQTGLAEAAIETLTGAAGKTVIVIAFEVAGLFEMHTGMEDVRIQDIRSPLTG